MHQALNTQYNHYKILYFQEPRVGFYTIFYQKVRFRFYTVFLQKKDQIKPVTTVTPLFLTICPGVAHTKHY